MIFSYNQTTLIPGDLVVMKPMCLTPLIGVSGTFTDCIEAHQEHMLLVIAIDKTRDVTRNFVLVCDHRSLTGWIEILLEEIITKA